MNVELGRDEKVVLAIAVLIMIFLASLFAYISFITPKKVDVSEIGENVGNFVEVSGIVGNIKQTQRGVVLKIYDKTFKNSTEAYLLFHTTLYPGERVVLRGEVSRYRGMVEILVKNKDDLKVLDKYLNLNIRELLTNPEFFVGMRVRIYGNMSSMVPSEYLELSDGFNFTRIYVRGGYFGERDVYIYGTYSDGIFRAENITLNYGGKCVGIGNLEKYAGKKVWIHGTTVSYFYHGYLSYSPYSLKVVSDRRISKGLIYLEGKFVYAEHSGQYELVVE